MAFDADKHDNSSLPVSNMANDEVMTYEQAEEMAKARQQMELAEALLYEHPDYVSHFSRWQKYYDVFESEDLGRYLHKHPREGDDIYSMRLSRAYFYNYCASVVNLFVSYLFKAPIERRLTMTGGSATDEDLETFRKDADLCGNSYESVMQLVATYAQVYGHTAVLVDVPEADDDIVSEQDRKAAGLRPYLTVMDATQIKDWEVDRFGKFEWVKVEVTSDDSRSFTSAETDEVRMFYVYDREGWTKYSVAQEKYATAVGSGEWPASIRGRVPIVIFRNEKKLRHEWFGSSSLKDIADINLAVMNWSTYGDEEIINRCLNLLVMQRDNTGDTMPTISHYNVIEYPPEAKEPKYLVPGETPLKLIGEWIDKAKDQIYRLAAMGGSTGLLGVREATSGIAYAYEFNETNQSLSKKAESMEKGESEVFELVAMWHGAEFSGQVSYPREFGVENFQMELDILLQARTTLTSETAIKELEKITVGKLFARRDTTFRETLAKEIDAAEAIPQGFVEGFGNVTPGMTSPNQAADPSDGEKKAENSEENE